MKRFLSLGSFFVSFVLVVLCQEVPAVLIPDNLIIKSDSLSPASPAPTLPPKEKKVVIVKREHDYKMQVYVAAAMMVFVAILMTSSQQWNP